jgi:hypothetical protein
MLTAYYNSQSVKLKQHIMGLKCKAIFLNMRICLYTPGTPPEHISKVHMLHIRKISV